MFMNTLDEKIQEGPIGRFFSMKERNATVLSELRGALVTFMSMAYILAVNPRILADSGGPCKVTEGEDYLACIEGIKREYITATAVGSMISCFLMGKYQQNIDLVGVSTITVRLTVTITSSTTLPQVWEQIFPLPWHPSWA